MYLNFTERHFKFNFIYPFSKHVISFHELPVEIMQRILQ